MANDIGESGRRRMYAKYRRVRIVFNTGEDAESDQYALHGPRWKGTH